MGSVRPPDAKGGATLDASDVLSLCKDLSRSSTSGSQETVECALALLSDLLSADTVTLGRQLQALLFGFSDARGSLQGCIPPPWWRGWGLCLDSAQISGGKLVNSCSLELSRVSASRGRQPLRLPAPPVSSQPDLKQRHFLLRPVPAHTHPSPKSCPWELSSHGQMKSLGRTFCPCLMLRSCHIAGKAAGSAAPAVLEVAASPPICLPWGELKARVLHAPPKRFGLVGASRAASTWQTSVRSAKKQECLSGTFSFPTKNSIQL